MAPGWRSRQHHYKQKLRSEVILFAVGALIVGFLFSAWADSQMKSSASYRHSLAASYSAPSPASDTFSDILQKQTVDTNWDSYTGHKTPPAPESTAETDQGKSAASSETPSAAVSPKSVSAEPAAAPALPALFSGPAASASYAWVEILLPAVMESTMPVVMDTAMHRLTSAMEAAGEHSLARRFTEEEFNRFVVDYVNRESGGQLRSMRVGLRPEGFLFQAQAFLGKDQFPVSGLIRFSLSGATPQLSIKELKIASHEVSGKTCGQLEKLVNQKITQKNYPLQVKEFQMKDGAVWMSVETT